MPELLVPGVAPRLPPLRAPQPAAGVSPQVGPAVPPYPDSFGDVRDVLRALPYPPDDGTRYALDTDIFTVRHALIRALDPQPRSVFEFGALLGFFLVTALDAAPSIAKVGWADTEQHTPDSNRLCDANLRDYCVSHSRPDTEVWWDNPHRALAFNPPRPYDLVHVDGDHTDAGCLLDLARASMLKPRVIMVDDWLAETHRHDVQSAVRMWLREQVPLWRLDVYETRNGLAVLTREAQ